VFRVNTAIARGAATQTDDSLAELGLSAQASPHTTQQYEHKTYVVSIVRQQRQFDMTNQL